MGGNILTPGDERLREKQTKNSDKLKTGKVLKKTTNNFVASGGGRSEGVLSSHGET